MQGLVRISRAIDRLNRWVGEGVALLTGLMVLIGAFNAIARYLEKDAGVQIASNAYLELQWYLFSLVFLLGSGYALAQNWHVRVDVIYGRVSARTKVWIDLVGTLLLGVPFCLLALWASWPSVQNSWASLEVSPDPGGLARYPIKSAILLGFALLLLQALGGIVKRIAWLRGDPLWPGALPELEEQGDPHETTHEGYGT